MFFGFQDPRNFIYCIHKLQCHVELEISGFCSKSKMWNCCQLSTTQNSTCMGMRDKSVHPIRSNKKCDLNFSALSLLLYQNLYCISKFLKLILKYWVLEDWLFSFLTLVTYSTIHMMRGKMKFTSRLLWTPQGVIILPPPQNKKIKLV